MRDTAGEWQSFILMCLACAALYTACGPWGCMALLLCWLALT